MAAKLAMATVIANLFVATSCYQAESTQVVGSSPLIDGIPSMTAHDAARRLPSLAKAPWEIIEHSRSRGRNTGEVFDDLVVVVHGYYSQGTKGDLRLEFFNDRLMSAWFYPDDYQLLVENLRKAGVKIATANDSSGEATASDTRVRAGSDHQGKNYVAWEDVRLIDQMNRWLLKNS